MKAMGEAPTLLEFEGASRRVDPGEAKRDALAYPVFKRIHWVDCLTCNIDI